MDLSGSCWRNPSRAGSGSSMSVCIVAMTDEHADAVLSIFQLGIDSGDATFETSVPRWEHYRAAKLAEHCFVALDETRMVVGWAAVSAVSDRCVYAGVVECSVYVHPSAQGLGVGRALLTALIHSTEQAGIWTIQAGIFPENLASRRLHASLGFRTVGTRERLGQQRGVWRDVILMERRSSTAG